MGVGTLTDEHSAMQSPLTARTGYRYGRSQPTLGRLPLASLCACLERAEVAGMAQLLNHLGQRGAWHVVIAGGELAGQGEAAGNLLA